MSRSLLLLGVLLALPVAAADVWTTPYPGVRMLKRTTSQPVVFWALEVDVCAPGIRFRVSAPSEGNRRTSSFGRLVGAQLAINGDFADHDFGLNLGSGVVWPGYPDTTHSGNFSVGPNRVEMTRDSVLLAAPYPWVTDQLGGRWTLLDDGVPQYGIDDNGPSSGGFVCAPGLRHPRTAIGLSRDKKKVFIIVADGRSSASIGMTCDELIDVFRELGAHDGMGLDGGGSSTLWKNDALINHPSDAAGERTVRNHLAIYASGTGAAPHCPLPPTPTEPARAAAVTSPTLPALTPQAIPSRFTPVTPTRLFDTRSAAGSARLVRSDGATDGPLSPTSSGMFTDWASAGLPADATAAWLNVAAIGGATPGYLTVSTAGRPAPATSNVNYRAGQATANAAPVALGAGARFHALTAAHVITDVTGAFTPSGAGLTAVVPTRVLDTRSPALPLQPGIARPVDVQAPAGAVGVVATVTVVAGPAAGFLTAYPCGAPQPATSNVNFAAGEVVANTVLSALGGGQLCLVSSSAADVVVDVTGSLSPGGPLAFVPVDPVRLLDTRQTTTPYTGRVAAGQVLELPVQALAGAPVNAGAVVVNVTVTGATTAGFLTAFPCGGAPPATSTVNFEATGATGALGVVGLGQGKVCVVSTVRAHVIVDVLGVWAVPPVVDAGVPPEEDAGVADAGTPPESDAGVEEPGDAGPGPIDDAGVTEPVADAGVTEPTPDEPADDVVRGASCSAVGGAPLLWLGLALSMRLSKRASPRLRLMGP